MSRWLCSHSQILCPSLPSRFLSTKTSILYKSNCTLDIPTQSTGEKTQNKQAVWFHFKLIIVNFKLVFTVAQKSNYMSKCILSLSNLSFLTNLECLSLVLHSASPGKWEPSAENFSKLSPLQFTFLSFLSLSPLPDFLPFTLNGLFVPPPWPVSPSVHSCMFAFCYLIDISKLTCCKPLC